MAPKGSKAGEKSKSGPTPEELMAEYERVRSQSDMLRQNLNLIGASLVELVVVKESLDKMKDLGEENEILVSLGGESFVRAKIIDREKVIVGLGSNVAVGKSIGDTMVDLEDQAKELEKLKTERTKQLQGALRKLEELTPMVQRVVTGLAKEG